MTKHHHHHGTAPDGRDWGELGAHMELQAEVMSPLLDQAMAWLRELAPPRVQRVLDLGCGPGVGSAALAAAFPDAEVLAVDRAPALLDMVRARAERLGRRITAVAADLEVGLGVAPPLDVAWVSMVLHHAAEPARVLRELHAALGPGGLLAIAEFGPPLRTLPDDLGFGDAGFEDRHREALRAAIEEHLPPGAMHLDWQAMLAAAGFEAVQRRTIAVDFAAPLHQRERRWIAQELARTAPMARERLCSADRATLDVLVDAADPRGVWHRTDLELHAGRALYVAHRP